MNLYPALVAQMGQWKYYIVKMKMRELASEVRFATEVYEDGTLDEAIQRDLNEGRARKQIVSFLTKRKDRFFSSLVVAAIGGQPKFYPVQISDDPQFALFSDQGLDQSFGVLTFSGEQKYYALDGQHRLKAIKTLLDRNDPLSAGCPQGFADEELSVLVVVKREEPMEQFMEAYRRLFSSLNRYAKPTDRDTNIIMDEDDTFAILTRRIISEHEFFLWDGRDKDSAKIKTQGKNIRANESYFTSLQTLYEMNKTWLNSALRQADGWGNGDVRERDIDAFIRFRPEEDYLDALFSELSLYWDCVIEVLPFLREQNTELRNHDNAELDNLLFWPIGQELLITAARSLLDARLTEEQKKAPTRESVVAALMPLASIDWRFHALPWRGLLLIKQADGWKIRSEDRKVASQRAQVLTSWLLNIGQWTTDDETELKEEWIDLLLPKPSNPDEIWTELKSQRLKS